MQPIAVVYNPEMPGPNGPYKKYTICQYTAGYIDLQKLSRLLNELEPGWGGSPTIIGSPQGESSKLDYYDIRRLMWDCIIVDIRKGLISLKDAQSWALASEEQKTAYTHYEGEEWKEAEWYWSCQGGSAYGCGIHVGESFSQWLEVEASGAPHKSLWK
jgi:hypothetical protein